MSSLHLGGCTRGGGGGGGGLKVESSSASRFNMSDAQRWCQLPSQANALIRFLWPCKTGDTVYRPRLQFNSRRWARMYTSFQRHVGGLSNDPLELPLERAGWPAASDVAKGSTEAWTCLTLGSELRTGSFPKVSTPCCVHTLCLYGIHIGKQNVVSCSETEPHGKCEPAKCTYMHTGCLTWLKMESSCPTCNIWCTIRTAQYILLCV